MYHVLLIALGGAIGASLRHGVNLGALRWFGPGFPAGTMTVNIFGSLAMGLLAGYLAARSGSQELRLFAATGILGGFTTFSAFSLDFALLWERGDLNGAAFYALGSVGLSLAAIFAGLFMARGMF
ncbi:MAG: fluoride efflux transporter CrcB [Rhizobiaceae bacterium]